MARTADGRSFRILAIMDEYTRECTDAWVISGLKKANEAKDWKTVLKLIDMMELVHNMSHSH